MSATSTSLTPLLAVLFDDPTVGRCLVAPDGTVLRANSEWLRSTGFDLDRVLGEDVVALFPASRDLALALHARARAGHHVDVPRHAVRIDGRETWWEGSIDPVPMEGGMGLLVTAREVSRDMGRSPVAGDAGPSRELLRAVVEQSQICIAVLAGQELRYTLVNPAYQAISPGTRMLGRTYDEVFPEAAASGSRARFLRVLETGEPWDVDRWRAPVPGKADATWRGRVVRLPAVPFEPPAALVVIEDITAQVRAEEAHRAEREKYRSLFEHSLDAVYLTERDGAILDANRAACRLHGMTLEEVRRAGRAGLVVTDGRHAAALKARADSGRVRAEMTVRRKDGTTVPVEVESVLLDPSRPDSPAFVISRDIAERKLREAALGAAIDDLRESEGRFRAVFESASDAVLVSDPSGGGRLLAANPAASRLFGYGEEELRTLDRAALLDTADANLARFLAAREDRGRTGPTELTYIRKDGTRFTGEITSAMFRTRTGEPRSVTIVRDVTDRRRAEEALREADRRKDEFLGMLSHELRNPLAPIRNALYILDRVDPAGPQARRAKDVANRQVAHLTRLVDDLLDVTRIARAKIELRRADLDLRALVLRAADDYRALMQDRGLELAVDVPDAEVVVNGDETRLAQVLGNLLSNAAKFTSAGGQVTLSLSLQADRAVVHVRDTGPGIAPEVLPTIFEPFTQAKQTLARSEGGLGLGLALVKGLVALHGGEVTAVTGDDAGTDFVFALPLLSRAD